MPMVALFALPPFTFVSSHGLGSRVAASAAHLAGEEWVRERLLGGRTLRWVKREKGGEKVDAVIADVSKLVVERGWGSVLKGQVRREG